MATSGDFELAIDTHDHSMTIHSVDVMKAHSFATIFDSSPIGPSARNSGAPVGVSLNRQLVKDLLLDPT